MQKIEYVGGGIVAVEIAAHEDDTQAMYLVGRPLEVALELRDRGSKVAK